MTSKLTRISQAFWFAAGLITASFASADVRLPRLISDNMVLQRDTTLALWGWADPGEWVNLQIHGQRASTKADRHGKWLAPLGPISAGGPYNLTVTGKNKIEVRNVMVGDVWVASGQSNMEFPIEANGGWMTGINNAEQEIARAQFNDIRLITVKHDPALKPQEDVSSDGWRSVTPETIGNFSAVAYEFGRKIHQRYGVPVGLIQSTFGGTLVEAWISNTALSRNPEYRRVIEAISSGDEHVKAAYERYRIEKSLWRLRDGNEDRGRVDGKDIWAAPELDVGRWPTIEEPRPYDAWARDFDGFDGVVWFRRVISLSAQESGKEMFLHLGATTAAEDVTYFNGLKVGDTQGSGQRDYAVPGKIAREGDNVITVRLVGVHDPDNPEESGLAMFGPASAMRAETSARTISLTGNWSYQPGPDLTGQPVISPAKRAAVRPWFNAPTELFNGMINPLLRVRIKGVIWYQGEQNTDQPARYRNLFRTLIQDWRQHWGDEFPFLFVQLAGFGPDESESMECKWAELREAQAMALKLPKTGMATAVDLGDPDDIHPRNKQDVAHRLALAAAKVAYGENVVYSGPTYQSMQIEGTHVRIRFSNIGGGLSIKGKYGYVSGFEIAGRDHRFAWAHARVEGSDVLVSSDSVVDPVVVRYDWGNTPDGNIFNREGLPAPPFRTDGPEYPWTAALLNSPSSKGFH